MLDEFSNLSQEAFDNSNKIDKCNVSNKGNESNNYNDLSITEKNNNESKKYKIITTTPMRNDSLNLDILTPVVRTENDNHSLRDRGRNFRMAKNEELY